VNGTTLTVDIVAVSVGGAPVANAGPDQTVGEQVSVTLDGSASANATSYTWTQVSGPAVTLSGSGATRLFTSPFGPTTLVFGLVVSNGVVSSAQDTVTITISVPCNDIGFRIQGPSGAVVINTNPSSPLKIAKNGTIYGISLVPIVPVEHPRATSLRINTPSGIMAAERCP
jgi:hypothetical protein